MSRSTEPNSEKKRKTNYYVPLMLFLFACVLYGNTIGNDYNMDDELVTRNHHLTSKGLQAIPEIFTSPYYKDQAGYAYEYRPVVLASFAIEHSLFGQHAWVSHLVNLLLYGITIVLLYLLLGELFSHYPVVLPLSATLLFAAHPLHTEAVASIKNRDELLAMLLALISWLLAIQFVHQRYWWQLLLAALFLIASLLSKLSTLALAFLIPFSLVCFLRSSVWSIGVVSACYAVIVFFIAPLHQLSHKVILFLVTAVLPVVFHKLFFGRFSFRAIADKMRNMLVFANMPVEDRDQLSQTPTLQWQPVVVTVISVLVVLLSRYFNYSALAFWAVVVPVVFLTFNIDKKFVGYLNGLSVIIAITAIGYDATLLYKVFVLLATSMMMTSRLWPLRWGHWWWFVAIVVPAPFLGAGAILFSATALITYQFLGRTPGFFVAFLPLVILSLVKATRGYSFDDFIILTMVAAGGWMVVNRKYSRIGIILMLVMMLYSGGYQLCKVKNSPRSFTQLEKAVTVAPALAFRVERPIDFVEMPLRYDSSLPEKLGTSAYILAEYLKLLFFPHPMRFYYGYAQVVPVRFDHIQSLLSAFIHVLLFLLAFFFLKKHTPLSYGIIFYLLSIAIFSNLLYPVVGMMADRFTYVASLGFCISLTYFSLKICRVHLSDTKFLAHNWPFNLLLGLVLLLWSAMTIARNAQWKDALTLMRHDIRYLEKSAQAHNLLAAHLMDRSLREKEVQKQFALRREAINHYRKALKIYPNFFNVWYDLARSYQLINHYDSAYICFKKVYEMDSTLSKATLSIALLAEYQGDIATAVQYYEKLIRINPYVKEAYANLSYLYFRLGRYEESIATNEKAIAYNADWVEPYENIARVYYFMKDSIRGYHYLQEAQKRKQKSTQ